jgi:DNA end-binding protein Ku
MKDRFPSYSWLPASDHVGMPLCIRYSRPSRSEGMRSIWKGSISFGLVTIPVAVYPATKEEKVSFKQLRKKDLSAIHYRKVAEADGKEVKADDIVKGFEYEEGRWVTLSDEDFAKVEISSTHTIEITDFVELSEINPKYFYKPYFLEAQKGGEKGYALLHRALSETGKVGIAKVAIRSREYLAAVKPDGMFLVLDLMHFAQEVLEPEELKDVTGVKLSPKELQMAQMLIDSMSGKWSPEAYEDRYQSAMRDVIERKIKQLPEAPKRRPTVAQETADILSILQKSLDESAAAGKRKGRGVAPRTTRTLVSQNRRPRVA